MPKIEIEQAIQNPRAYANNRSILYMLGGLHVPLQVTKSGKRYLIVAVEHMSVQQEERASALTNCSVTVNFVKQEILNVFGLRALY